MSNAHKIIKNFTSDKFSPELKEKLWKWLVDSSEQAEKEEALMELWGLYRSMELVWLIITEEHCETLYRVKQRLW